MFGVLLVHKPSGMTSHDAVYKVRRSLGTKKVGHAGTLDPMATGLLVMAVGPATRFLRYLELEPKVYEFVVTFGQSTNTYDAEGETVKTAEPPTDLEARVRDELVHFLGDIEQLAPMFSAVKKDGKPLYAYARKGEHVEREPRSVTVFSLEALSTDPPNVRLKCVCSGGTYVRTLAHDLGERIGCGAHVSELTRTAIGRFELSEAVDPSQATGENLLPLAEALHPMPVMRLTDGQLQLVRNGNFLKVEHAPNERLAALTDGAGHVVCVARVMENELHPECVVPMEALLGQV